MKVKVNNLYNKMQEQERKHEQGIADCKRECRQEITKYEEDQ